jgi:glycosyltransferase involved in cell wall biosynthesis
VKIAAIIPALDEQAAIGQVVGETLPLVRRVIVADNGSTDRTAEVARRAGALVVREPKKGYGYACLRAMQEVADADIVVFLDGDHSDVPEDMERLTGPIQAGEADLVIGSRIRGRREKGALLPHALVANLVFAALVRLLCGLRVTDIGPFRAIRSDCLFSLEMSEGTYGWTLEMMIKASRRRLRVAEVPVSYRKRIGRSKVSGSLWASLKAGAKMAQTIFKYLR